MRKVLFIGLALLTLCLPSAAQLPSWNDGAARQTIIDFVADVTTEGSEHDVTPEDRIAVFDNDGTLWSER